MLNAYVPWGLSLQIRDVLLCVRVGEGHLRLDPKAALLSGLWEFLVWREFAWGRLSINFCAFAAL